MLWDFVISNFFLCSQTSFDCLEVYGPAIENISSEEGTKLEMCSTTADNSKLDSLIIADMQNALLHSKVVDVSMKLYDCESFTDELMKLECYGNLVSLWFFLLNFH